MSHQQRLDLKREGKPDQLTVDTPEARPGSRDPDAGPGALPAPLIE